LAIADHNRFVHLFDENGERRDKFATKAADPKAAKTYVIRGMQFSPDSTKLAIAQSDNIVFVYKLGLDWGDKKSICNKFQQTSTVTSLCWPNGRYTDLIFGVADGKVKMGFLKTNKSQTLYSTDSYVVAIAASADGLGIVSGHLDGSVYRYFFNDDGTATTAVTHAKLAHHPCVPYALAWGEHIVACGNDCKVVFYDRMGSQLQHFDYPMTEEKEFTCAQFNPSGQCLIVGAWNKFRVYTYNPRTAKWEDAGAKPVPNMYSVTSLGWKADGSRLVVTSLCGAVDMYDACIRRYRYKGKFEFTYVSHSTVIVKRLSTGTRIVLKSQFGYEILKVNVYQDRYLVAHTDTTLLMGDLVTCKLSEVQWNSSAGHEKFFFDNPQVCMVYHAGELTLVEYGRNDILGVCRTENISTHLISVRVEEDHAQAVDIDGMPLVEEDKRKKTIAYLIDRQTIRILDLVTQAPEATVWHTTKIDWLELNRRATKLLFRDKNRQLFLYNIATQERSTLLNFCSYVQWVPDSDVVVAQNRGDLCVWYSIDTPDRVAIVPIKGQVEDIERTPGGKTEVVVDEGVHTVAYGLDEALIEFGNAMDQREYERACHLLEQITLTPETEAMWQNLSQVALQEGRMPIAERCFAALGDVSKARALNTINDLAARAEQEQKSQPDGGHYNGYTHYTVRSALAILHGEFKKAEQILVEQNKVEEAMAMWEELHRFDESIELAAAKGHPQADSLKDKYFEWLVEQGQEEKAGEMREREQRYDEAINLYLQGGLPARAALVVTTKHVQVRSQMLEAIASSLMKAGMYEKAGDFFERLNMDERAIEAYKKGHAFRRAVELSRKKFPGYVVTLEEAWGDWLVSQKQIDQAINHYIEGNQYVKAIEAAITSRQWAKAVQIVDTQDPNDPITKKFYKLIASHYEDSRQHAEAEKYYIKSGLRQEAVEMYTRNNMWESAHRVAKMYMSEQEIAALYINQAQQLEVSGKYKEAERLYLKVNEPDLAIHMYKKARKFDDMIRLVNMYRKELLQKTHQTLAAQMEREGNLKAAEYHYAQAKEWKAACNMYREAGNWEDAIRVAKLHGGVNAMKQVVFAWAVHLGGDMGAKLLTKFGLVEQAIDYAIESGHFDHALELANSSLKSKLAYVHLKHAMYLEDEGRFQEAEVSFVKAGKPKEAIDMYVHQRDWTNALRVADSHDPPSVTDVLVAQAKEAFDKGLYEEAEHYLLRASKPELLVKIYKEARMWSDAQRIAREYCPAKLTEVTADYAQWMHHNESAGDPSAAGKLWEDSGEYNKAIDAYLKVTKQNNHGKRADQLCQLWQRAVDLSYMYAKDRLPETLSTVEQYLIGLNRYEDAGRMYEDVDMFKEAVNMYMQGELYDRAQPLAEKVSPALAEEVRNKIMAATQSQIDGDDLADRGDVDGAMSVYYNQGDWPKLMELARKSGDKSVKKYSPPYIQFLLEQGQVEEAVKTAMRDGLSEDHSHASIYAAMLESFLKILPVRFDYSTLADQVLKFAKALRGGPTEGLERLAVITHMYNMGDRCKKTGLFDLWGKVMLHQCRNIDIIPADKAFYDAGMAAKRCAKEDTKGQYSWSSYAFVYLNRFLDINEMMEDPEADPTMMDNGDFVGSEIPIDFPIPKKHAIPNEKLEEVRQWVLTASLDQTIEQKLPSPEVKISAELEDIFKQICRGQVPSVLQLSS
jgi:intraflagellar transport protein 172